MDDGPPLLPAPDLTAVMVVGADRSRCRRGLESLLAQDVAGRLEVLVMDLAAATGALPVSPHPAMRTVALPPDTVVAEARARAAELARAPVVAFVEEHAWVLGGWATALLEAFRGPWAGVGPLPLNGNPEVGHSEIVWLMNHGPFAVTPERGEATMIPGYNSSYRRDVLLAYGDRLAALLSSENVLLARLVADGHRLFLEPAARIAHLNEVDLKTMGRGYFLHNRVFGHRRAATFGWPWWKRLATALAFPLIPFYYLLRFSRVLSRRAPEYRLLLWRNSGFVLACQFCGAAGYALGLLLPLGGTEAAFTEYECTAERPSTG